MKSDDYTLPVSDRQHVRKQADRLLREASAYGRFPTPVKDIVAAAKLTVRPMDELVRPEAKANEKVKRAVSKLQGFLHRRERVIYIDKNLHGYRKKSLSMHEVGHDYLPEQRELFQILEDSEHELDDETLDTFERAANCFASDLHFQLDSFTSDARDLPFGIVEPVKQLTRRYGAGNYSTLRRYTEVCGKAAGLLICDHAPTEDGGLAVRRFVCSPEFSKEVGAISWPQSFGPSSWFTLNKPRNVFAWPSLHILKNRRGRRVPCMIESFDSSRQIFFLIRPSYMGSAGIAA